MKDSKRFKGGVLDELSPSKRRPTYHTPGQLPRSKPGRDLDERIAEGSLPKFMAQEIIADRKRIGKRHARRKMRTATQRHMRRKRWGRA